MADTDNLKIQQEMNKAISDRRAILAAQTREMQSQLQISLQLKAVMDGLSADDLTKRFEEAQKALDALGASSSAASQTSSQAMAAIVKSAGSANTATDKLVKTTKLLQAKYPSLKSVGAAAITGLSQGFTNLLSLTKGVAGVIEGMVSGIFELGKAIIAIPLRIFQGLIKSAADFTGDTSLMQAFENLRKEFGSFKEDVSKNVITSFHEIQKGLTGTGLSAFKVLGQFSKQLEYFTEQFKQAGAQASNFGSEIAKTAGTFTAFEKGLAVGENLKGMMDKATIAGTDLGEQFRLVANYSLQMGKNFGISQKVLAKDIGMMMKDVKNFGSLTQKEMSVTAVYTRKLGIEVKSLLGLVDKFDTFEDAADNAAKLNQAFGASVDAFKMMQEQDPAKRIDMLRKSMQAAGKTTENMSRQELQLLSQTTGLDEATAKLAFSAKNQGVSYADVQKQSEKAQKSQLTQTQAVAKLADSIERVVIQGQKLGSFFEMFINGFERGIKWSKPFLDMVQNIRQALMDTYFAGIKLGKTFANLPEVSKFLESFGNIFAPNKFHKLLDGVVDSFTNFFKSLSSGQFSVKKLLEDLQKNFLNWFDDSKQEGKNVLDGAKKLLKTFAGIIGQGIKFVVEKLTDGLTSLAEFVQDPAKFLAKLNMGGAKSGAMGILQPLLESLSNPKLWQNLLGAMEKLMSVVFTKLKAFFSGPVFMGLVKEYWPIVAGILFGPALTRMLAATLLQTIVAVFSRSSKSVGSAIKGGVQGIGKAAEQAAGAGKGGALTPDNLPSAETQKGLATTVQALAKLKAGDVVKAGFNGLLMAAFIGGALVVLITELALAAKIVQTMKVDTKSMTMVMGATAAIVLEMIPMMIALRIAAKMPLSEVMKGLLATGIVVGAMAAGLAIITLAFNGLKLNNVESIAKSMATMGVVFLAASAVAAIALVVGAALSGPQAILAAIGLGAIVVVIGAMATSMISIMKSLNQVDVGPGFTEKVSAFSEIAKAIGSLTGNLASMISAASPSWVELLTGKGSTLNNLKELESFVDQFIGHVEGLVKTIMTSVSQMGSSPEMLAGARSLGEIMTGVSALAQAFLPPAGTKGWFDSAMNTIRGESSDTQFNEVNNYVKRMIGNVTDLIQSIMGGIKSITSLGITEEGMKGIDAFSKVSMAVVEIIKAVTPSPEMLKMMSSSAKTSALWGVTSAEASKFDGKALSDMGTYFKSVLDSVGPMLGALTGGAVTAVVSATKNIDDSQLKKIGVVTGIISTVTDFMGKISDIASKSGKTATFSSDKGKIDATIQAFPSIGEVLTEIEKHIPIIVSAMESVNVPTDLKFQQKLDGIKKIFDVVNGMTSVFKGISTGGATPNTDGIVSSIASVAIAISRIFFGGGAFGTSSAPMTELVASMRTIEANASNFLLTGNEINVASQIKKSADAITSIAAALKELQDAGNSISTVDFTKLNVANLLPGKDNVAPYIAGVNEFAKQLAVATAAVKNDSLKSSLTVVRDVVKSVNELNTLLASGDAAKIDVSTNLKKFVDNAGLGNKQTYTVQNKGISMTVNMNVSVNAADMEEAIVFRKSSIIREGIKDADNFNNDQDDTVKRKLNNFS